MATLSLDQAINSHPERLGGELCFTHTRVPVQSLFDHLEEGYTLDEFLASFPAVSRDQALVVLHEAGSLLLTASKK